MDDVGNAAQIADVKKTVMRRAIIAGKPTAIHAEDNRQVLQANVVHDGIEGTLQESGVDGTERAEAHGGQAGSEDDAVLLGDAHIEIPARVMGRKRSSAVPLGMAAVMATTLGSSSASLTRVSAKTSE